jgi:hypothetical protein
MPLLAQFYCFAGQGAPVRLFEKESCFAFAMGDFFCGHYWLRAVLIIA